jgi:hypothetical protein
MTACEWEVRTKGPGAELDPGGTFVPTRLACPTPATHVATRLDFPRPIRTCTEHVKRARRYGFSIDGGQR